MRTHGDASGSQGQSIPLEGRPNKSVTIFQILLDADQSSPRTGIRPRGLEHIFRVAPQKSHYHSVGRWVTGRGGQSILVPQRSILVPQRNRVVFYFIQRTCGSNPDPSKYAASMGAVILGSKQCGSPSYRSCRPMLAHLIALSEYIWSSTYWRW